MWMTLLPTIASGLLGANQAARQQQQQKAGNLAQAELTRYSPWTGMQGQLDMSAKPSALEGGFSGAIKGLGMGQALNQAFSPKNSWADLYKNMDADQQAITKGITAPQPVGFGQKTMLGNADPFNIGRT